MPKDNRAEKRAQIRNVEELKRYLTENWQEEKPFNERCYADALAKSIENKEFNKKNIDPSKRKKVENPISIYFQTCSLKTYSDESDDTLLKNISSTKKRIEDIKFKLPDGVESDDSVVQWIQKGKKDESDFLMQRFIDYYNTYEINDGADKISLKRLLSLELLVYRIDNARISGDDTISSSEEAKITKQINDIMESLKWTKKQRSARDDMAQNKFSLFMDKLEKDDLVKFEQYQYPKDQIDILMEELIENYRRAKN